MGESKFYIRLSSSTTQYRNLTLEFVAAPAPAPSEIIVDLTPMALCEAELKRVRSPPQDPKFKSADFTLQQAAAVPLPEDDMDTPEIPR